MAAVGWGVSAGEARSDSVWGGKEGRQGLAVLHLTRAADPEGGDREQRTGAFQSVNVHP